jgi:Tripartite tricarboxylate transporter family receptor
VLTVHAALPVASVAQFGVLAKARPGKLNHASAGVGTSPQLSMALFRMEAGIDIVHFPCKDARHGCGVPAMYPRQRVCARASPRLCCAIVFTRLSIRPDDKALTHARNGEF